MAPGSRGLSRVPLLPVFPGGVVHAVVGGVLVGVLGGGRVVPAVLSCVVGSRGGGVGGVVEGPAGAGGVVGVPLLRGGEDGVGGDDEAVAVEGFGGVELGFGG